MLAGGGIGTGTETMDSTTRCWVELFVLGAGVANEISLPGCHQVVELNAAPDGRFAAMVYQRWNTRTKLRMVTIEADEAWRVAVDHVDRLASFRWHQLIELRQPTHPQDVIEPLQRLIQSGLEDKSDEHRYRNAIDMLRRLRDAYRAAGDTTGFGNYVDGLRDRHKRKDLVHRQARPG